jgi:osmotically-inducible protein OsmY
MARAVYVVAGAALGSAAVFLLDPERGRSRRAELAQRSGKLVRRARQVANRQATRAMSEAEGLRERAGHLQVEDQHPTPERLKERVESVLFRDPGIPKGDVVVDVESDAVVLRGRVGDSRVRSRIERKARRIQGVDRVENLISVG